MTKYDVVILGSVEKLIRKNYRYIAETYDNEAAAIAHTRDIYATIKSLETFPLRCAVRSTSANYEYRAVRAKQYLIFYRVDEKRKMVIVVDLLHSHQNPGVLRFE